MSLTARSPISGRDGKDRSHRNELLGRGRGQPVPRRCSLSAFRGRTMCWEASETSRVIRVIREIPSRTPTAAVRLRSITLTRAARYLTVKRGLGCIGASTRSSPALNAGGMALGKRPIFSTRDRARLRIFCPIRMVAMVSRCRLCPESKSDPTEGRPPSLPAATAIRAAWPRGQTNRQPGRADRDPSERSAAGRSRSFVGRREVDGRCLLPVPASCREVNPAFQVVWADPRRPPTSAARAGRRAVAGNPPGGDE